MMTGILVRPAAFDARSLRSPIISSYLPGAISRTTGG